MTDNESQMSCTPKDQQFYKVIVIVESQCAEIGLFYAHIAHSQVRETSRLYPFRLRMLNSPLHTCGIFFRLFVHLVPAHVILSCVIRRHRKDTAVCSWSKPKRDNVAPPSKPPPLPLFVHIWCFPPPNQGVKRCCLQLLYVGGTGKWARWKLPASPSPFREPWE